MTAGHANQTYVILYGVLDIDHRPGLDLCVPTYILSNQASASGKHVPVANMNVFCSLCMDAVHVGLNIVG